MDQSQTMNAPQNRWSSPSTCHNEVPCSFKSSWKALKAFSFLEAADETSSSSENSPSNVSRKHKPSYQARKSAKTSAMMKRHMRSSSGYSSSHNEETTFRWVFCKKNTKRRDDTASFMKSFSFQHSKLPEQQLQGDWPTKSLFRRCQWRESRQKDFELTAFSWQPEVPTRSFSNQCLKYRKGQTHLKSLIFCCKT